MSGAISRAELLIQQSKYNQAEKEIKVHLAENPNDGLSHSTLALAYLGQKKEKEALESAEKGVGLMPFLAYPFYILSRCHIHNSQYEKAFDASSQALNLDPEDEDFLCNHAAILSSLNKNEEALVTLNKALAINPEHANSKEIKSVVLRNLGRYAEADEIAGDALSEAPESSSAFSAKGWALLDNGKTKEALEHFKTAVMLDPNSEYAKSGLIMGIKAQNKLFHWFYMYYNWISRLSPKTRWGLAIGIVILIQFADRLSRTGSTLAPILDVLVTLYICFVFLAWSINPVFNIFLRFNRFGKHALSKGETIAANIMASLLISAAIFYTLTFMVSTFPISGALGALFLTLPVAGTFTIYNSPKFKRHAAYTILLALLLLAEISLATLGYHTNGIWNLFLIGVVGYSWISQIGK